MRDKQAKQRSDTTGEAVLRAPRLDPRTIARPRLVEALKQERHRRCLILQAPAGCGKTTVLGAWRRELVALGVKVAWVALGEGDDDVARFVDALIVAVSAIDADMARQAVVLAERGDAVAAIEGIAIALVRGMAAHPHAVALVFDDTHHLRDPRIVGALQLLLDHGPAHLLCIFASRTPLTLSLARLRDQGELLELGFEALRFTAEESHQLVKSLLGEADDGQAHALHAMTDGWAAGLKLLCLERRRHGAAQRAGDVRVRDAKTFAHYFESEVMARLSPHDMRLFVRCALAEHFNAALCDALQDGEPSTGWAADLLARLESQGLFMMSAGPRYPEGWWRLHPLLRDVLLTHLRALPPAEQQRLHAIAWRWFAASDMPHDAVHHALQAGAAAAAADLVERSASALFVRGELRHLAALVRQLPLALVQERTGLRLWMAWGQVYERRLPDCARSIAQLQLDMAQAAPAERYRLTLLRGLYALQCDDTAAAMAILDALRDAPADADAIALTGRRNLLTWIHLYRGEYEKARLVQLEPAPRMPGGEPLYGTPFGVLAGRCLVGLTHAVEGQMILAERIYRDVLYEADRRGASCVDAGCLAAGLLAEVLYELSDTAGAVRLLEERLDVLEQVSIPDTAMRVMLVMVRSHRLAGRPFDALAYAEQISDEAERMGLDRLRAYGLMEQVQLHLQRHAPEIAQQCMAELDLLDARHADAEVGTLSEIRVAAERARIALAMHGGDAQAALARLDALDSLCRQRGRVRRIPHQRLQAAVIESQQGRHAQAQAHVREALRIGHSLGLVRTLLDAHASVPALIAQALDALRDDPVLAFYAERLLAAARAGAPGAIAQTSAQESRPARAARSAALQLLSPRETEIVQLLLQAMSNKKIARVLDLSLDTVKWHLKNCYGKLGVSGRDEVIERLRDADLS